MAVTVLGMITVLREPQKYSAAFGMVVTSLAKVMCGSLLQQVPVERIALVHSKAGGAGLDDGLAEEMTGLVEGLAMADFPDGVDVGLDGLVVEGRLLGDIEPAETRQFSAKTLVVYNIKSVVIKR
jgi:hypothetical protein